MFLKKRHTYRKLHDEDLILLYREKQKTEIIGEIYNRYGHMVMGTAMKYLKNQFDAEDLTMNLFEKLPNKLLTNQISQFKGWLYMVTKNECLMLLRKKGFQHSDLPVDILSDKEDTELHLKKEEQLIILEKTILELKDDQRKCIELFYLKRQSYDQISSSLGLDIKKVKSAIQNGKRNLKIKLEGNHEFKSAI